MLIEPNMRCTFTLSVDYVIKFTTVNQISLGHVAIYNALIIVLTDHFFSFSMILSPNGIKIKSKTNKPHNLVASNINFSRWAIK